MVKMLCFYIIILTLSPVLRHYHSKRINIGTVLCFLSQSLSRTPERKYSGRTVKLYKNWNKFNYYSLYGSKCPHTL